METLGNGSSQPLVDAYGNGYSSLIESNGTQQYDDKVNAFLEFAYEKLTKERDEFQKQAFALEFKNLHLKKTMEEQKLELDSKKAVENENIRLREVNAEFEAKNKKHLDKLSTFEKQQEADRQVHDKEKKTFEGAVNNLIQINAGLEVSIKKQLEKITLLENLQQLTQEKWGEERKMLERKIARMEQSLADLQPHVFKKLISYDDADDDSGEKVWHCYSAYDDKKEKPVAELSMIDPSLIINGAVSQKQIILDGFISQYEVNPFTIGNIDFCYYDRHSISRLLQKVHSCYLTAVYISNQSLTWMEYQKLVSGGRVLDLYFSSVEIKDEYDVAVPLENILEKLPNVRKFAYFGYFNVTKQIFMNLIKLPYFYKLKEFNLNVIRYQDFDADSFLAFMKKHRKVHFSFSFFSFGFGNYSKTQLESMKLLERRASPYKLEIKY